MLLVFFFLGFLISFILTTCFWLYIAYIKAPKISRAFHKWLEFYKECDVDWWSKDNEF